jgi:hypothetical protein
LSFVEAGATSQTTSIKPGLGGSSADSSSASFGCSIAAACLPLDALDVGSRGLSDESDARPLRLGDAVAVRVEAHPLGDDISVRSALDAAQVVRQEVGDRRSLLEHAATRLRAPPQRQRTIEELEHRHEQQREHQDREQELDEREAAAPCARLAHPLASCRRSPRERRTQS